VEEHRADCDHSRNRHVKSSWFQSSAEMQNLTKASTEQVKGVFMTSRVKPSHANALKISSDLRFGVRGSWIERTFAFPSLIWKCRTQDPEGTYILQTILCPINIPNVAEGSARSMDYVFFCPSTSRKICDVFPNIVTAMDAAFRKHETGGVEYLLSMKNGMGSNTFGVSQPQPTMARQRQNRK